MEIALILIAIIILGIVCACLTIVLWSNDFSLPELDLFQYKREGKPLTIVAIYPHPDDETMAVGGTLAKYAKLPDTRVIVLTTTHGEKGETNNLCAPDELFALREKELQAAAKAMGVDELILWEYPDSELDLVVEDLTRKLRTTLPELEPDVIFTYDATGLYGHPDHIVLNGVVRQVVQQSLPQAKVLYTTLPGRILKQLHLPTKITLHDRVIELDKKALQHTLPEYRSTFWREMDNKMRAVDAHKSQNIGKHLPLPVPLFRLVGWVEYFSED